jgi:hypothetical protein
MGKSRLEVVTDELKSRARWIESRPWPSEVPDVEAPDALESTQTAIKNLNDYGETLQGYTAATEKEGLRLANSLNIVVEAYERVDAESKRGIENEQGRVDQIPPPQSAGPEPELPPKTAQPGTPNPDTGDIRSADAKFQNPGVATSADHAAWLGNDTAGKVEANAPAAQFAGWYGDAATAAGDKFDKFSEWVGKLAGAWRSWATEADGIVRDHNLAKHTHDDVYKSWKDLYNQMRDAVKNNRPQSEIDQIAGHMHDLEETSKEVRKGYANALGRKLPDIPEPPFGTRSASQGSVDGTGKQGGGQGGSGNSGGQSDGSGQSQQSSPSVSPASTDPTSAQQAQSGSPSSSGSPSGGSPSGSGSPAGGSGGSPAGGLPSGLSGAKPPELPKIKEPSLKPASLGGGSGAGGGGGGGGGVPHGPLGPAVSSETVSPSPSTAKGGAVPAGASAPGPGAGSMGGGMGGGGMGHGAGHGNQAKEKRRDPNLAPDEDLYVEDRAHTEAVVGHRPRKTQPKDSK